MVVSMSQYLSELLESEANGVGIQCTTCSLHPGILHCTDCFGDSVWCKGCGLSSHMSLPFHWIQIWDGKCFVKSSLLEQGFVMHLGHNGQSCPVQRNPWKMCQWLEPKKRRSKRQIYLKMFLGLWAVRILLSLLTAMGFSFTTSNGVLAQDLPPITSNCSDMVYFSQCHPPQDFFHFDVLDHFYMDAMECKTAGLSFFQKLRRFTNNAALASVPVGLHHP